MANSYAQRMQDTVVQARKEAAKDQVKAKINISDKEIKFAESLVRLLDNEDYKVVLELFNDEIGNLMTSAFSKPSESDFGSKSWGEQMAYKKGRYDQMIKFRQKQMNLISRYIHRLENEKPEKEVEDG